jgi:heat shock protein HslJ/membrane-bound inhibitor of C-type lysozyme
MNCRPILLPLTLLIAACSERPATVETRSMEQSPGAQVEQGTARPQHAAQTQRYSCGELSLQAELQGDQLTLTLPDGRRLSLQPTVSASGARYTGPDDTEFWSKGERASLRIDGENYPECFTQSAEILRAHGNEPGWQLRLHDDHLELTLNYGAEIRRLPLLDSESLADGVRYIAGQDQQRAEVTVTEQLCSDTMSDLPFPLTVSLTLDNQQLQGCGGSPAELLNDTQWMLLSIDDHPVVENSAASLTFSADGRVAGSGSCNRYTASWQLDGEALTVSQAVSTRMACLEPLMQQEQAFLDRLQRSRSFWIDAQGQLLLRGEAGWLIAKAQTTPASDRPRD